MRHSAARTEQQPDLHRGQEMKINEDFQRNLTPGNPDLDGCIDVDEARIQSQDIFKTNWDKIITWLKGEYEPI